MVRLRNGRMSNNQKSKKSTLNEVIAMEQYVRNQFNMQRAKRKKIIDKVVKGSFFTVTLFCASIIILIVLFIMVKGLSPFINEYIVSGQAVRVDFLRFMYSDTWFVSPNMYGVGFIILNTIFIVLLSLIIALPISILTSLFVVKMAPKWLGKIISTINEMLASIPSIVYGVFGFGVITNLVKNIASLFGLQTAGGLSTLATVIVLAIMIMPTVTMLSTASIQAVKSDVEWGSFALGASKRQTNFKVVLNSAKSGIFAGIILGVGRALGEATAVSMVAGNRGSGPTFNLFDTTRTLTSTMLMGLKETTGLDFDIRFSVGVVLIVLIFVTNFALNKIKEKVGNQYA